MEIPPPAPTATPTYEVLCVWGYDLFEHKCYSLADAIETASIYSGVVGASCRIWHIPTNRQVIPPVELP